MFARESALSLALVLFTAGCSSSSSGGTTPSGDDSGNAEPNDADTTGDATVDDSGVVHEAGGGDGSSPHDGGTATPDGSSPSGAAAGDAGAAAFCAAVCTGLVQCADAGTVDAGDAGACHCNPGDTALHRGDYVAALTACAPGAIEAKCSDTATAVQGCQVTAAAGIDPTAAAAAFCKDLEFTFCSGVLPNCLTNAGVYGDTTISAFAKCLPDVPDADVDGGCNAFATCLGTATTP